MANTLCDRVKSSASIADVRAALRPLLGSAADSIKPGDKVEYKPKDLQRLQPVEKYRITTILAKSH